MTNAIRFDAPAASFLCTPAMAATLNALASMRHGGIGTIHGYRPTSGYVTPPTMDVQVITKFSTARLYDRKRKALDAVTFADVADGIAADDKLAALPLAAALAAFEARKADMVASLSKTLDGDRSDAHRAGHDRCYCTTSQGVKVNYVTVKGDDGLMHPVLTDGLPTAASIMVGVLELGRKVTVEGVRKPAPNSGIPVRMGNAIDKVLNRRSVGYTTRTLKADNFTAFTASGQTVTAQDVAGHGAGEAIMDAALAA